MANTLTFANLTLDDSNIFGGISYICDLNAGDEFSIGNTASACVSFVTDTQVPLYSKDQTNGTFTWAQDSVSKGRFYITEVTKNGGMYSVTAYDAMYLTEKNISALSLTLPISVTNCASAIATYIGCTVSGTIKNGSLTATSLDEEMTIRELLGRVAEASGCSVKIDGFDHLRFMYYADSQITVTASEYIDLEVADYTCAAIDNVTIFNSEGEVQASAGSGTNSLYIGQNPFMENATNTNATNIYNAVKDFVYAPLTCSMFEENGIEVGTIATFGTTPTLVMHLESGEDGATVSSVGSDTRAEYNKDIMVIINETREIAVAAEVEARAASASAAQAASSASAAASSASSAATSASNAESSASTAASQASAAATSAGNAATSAQNAAASASSAASDASAAQASASNAEASASTAETAATNAEADASSASASASSAASDASAAASSASSASSSASTAAQQATAAAGSASTAALQATAASGSASQAAASASTAASQASAAAGSASQAAASAAHAGEYAARALGDLGAVESVAETLAWITQHGTMTLTTDTSPDPSHVYFVQDANGDYVVGGTHYSVVPLPDASQMSNYYELSIDQSLNNYVATHLVVDSDGLWIIPDSGGNRVLISVGAQGAYSTPGTYIIGKVNGNDTIFAKFTADGATMQAENGTLIAHLGYGLGTGKSGTASAPYYTFGTRKSGGTIGNYSTAEGQDATASGYCSHAEGEMTTAGRSAHAEGYNTTASGLSSHAEGERTTASGQLSHAEGQNTTASELASHAEGNFTTASGSYAHAQGNYTIAQKRSQTAIGEYNIADTYAYAQRGRYAFIIGNGTADDARSNAFTVNWNGNVVASGSVTDGTGNVLSAKANTSSLATVATTGAYSDLSGTPNLATVATTGAYSDLSGTPTLATVASTGSYNDLSNKPTNVSDFTNDAGYLTTETDPTVPSWAKASSKPSYTAGEISGLATVATSGDYDDLSNKPSIPKVAGGQVTNLGQISANSYKDATITHNLGAGAIVVATLFSSGTAANIGQTTCTVHSVDATTAKIRVFNNRSSTLSPYINWIAFHS